MCAFFLSILVLVALFLARVAALRIAFALERVFAEEEAIVAAKAADAGVSPEEYRRRQAEIEAEWARREFAK